MNLAVDPIVDSVSQPATPSAERESSWPAPHEIGPPPVVLQPTPPHRSLHVLCIDDDEQILESLKDCLAHFGHRVKVASGGKYGIEMFCTAVLKSEPYDMVITDLSMPDVNGYEVTRQIKAESPDTPLVLMTGAGTTKEEARLMSAPVDAVVGKPPRMRELNALLLALARPV
ncbi:MAG TPA: response regulator [Candidatus Acidoferrum sp.]|nr:response regulator [Candidatus Acidoferrum sp.]